VLVIEVLSIWSWRKSDRVWCWWLSSEIGQFWQQLFGRCSFDSLWF